MKRSDRTRPAGRWRGRPWVMLALDAATLVLAFVLSYCLRTSMPVKSIQSGGFYVLPGAVVVGMCLVSLVFSRAYEDRRYLRNLERYVSLVQAIAIGLLLVTALTFLFKAYDYSRGLLLTFWVVGTGALCVERLLFYRVLGRVREAGFDNIPVVLVALAGKTRQARAMLGNFPQLGYRVTQTIEIGRGDGVRALERLVQKGQVEGVVIGVPERSFHKAVPYMGWCEQSHVPYHRVSGDFDMFFRSARDMQDLMSLEPKPVHAAVKAVFDRVVSALLLAVAAPLWLLVAMIVRLESPGPALFVQDRVGRNGKLFRMYKFRTMYAHAPRYALTARSARDPRVTPVGGFLRRTSLDELPQLLNVLKGEMSLVGPRPEMPFMVDRNTPLYRRRLMVLPGMTGLWQVVARDEPLEESLRYDLYYIQHRSFVFDLVILARTVLSVLSGRGAY